MPSLSVSTMYTLLTCTKKNRFSFSCICKKKLTKKLQIIMFIIKESDFGKKKIILQGIDNCSFFFPLINIRLHVCTFEYKNPACLCICNPLMQLKLLIFIYM